MRVAVPHPDPAAYRFAHMLYRVPSDWSHTASAFPLPSTANCASRETLALSVSMSVALPHPDPAAYWFAQMLYRVPSDWDHTASAFPLPSAATCGSWAELALSVSMRVAVPPPEPAAYRFAQMLYRVPSH